jgi:hypothetical protein
MPAVPPVYVPPTVPPAFDATNIQSVPLSAGTAAGVGLPNYTLQLSSIAGSLYSIAVNLQQYLQLEASVTAAGTGSSYNVQAVIANSLDGIMQNLDSMNQLSATSTGALADMQKAFAGINTSLNDMTANIQLAASNQIDKAEFDKAATNAALKRNNLPEVEVAESTVSTSISKSAGRAVTMATAVQTTSLVSTAIQKGTTFAGQQVDQYVVTPATNLFTKIFGSTAKAASPDALASKSTTETKKGVNSTKLFGP